MSARVMYDNMNQKAPSKGKEKHHGNKRKMLARLKVQARRAERRAYSSHSGSEAGRQARG